MRFKTSTFLFAFTAMAVAAAGTLAWRGQVCVPMTFVIVAAFAGLFAALVHEDGN